MEEPEEENPAGGLINGDPVDYNNPNSEHNGKRGTFLGVRADGKFRIRFADGVILAASPKYVTPYNDPNKIDHLDVDPLGEENWNR